VGAQVLVTVPQCLGILLLSAEQHGWVSRIKNVIFDEVPRETAAASYLHVGL